MKVYPAIVLLAYMFFPWIVRAETHRFAVVVGNNQGHDEKRALWFAEQDAEKVHSVLTQLGGFKKANTRLILGSEADAVWRQIATLEKQIKFISKKADTKTLLLFYYSGHAEGDVLEMGSSSFQMKQLLDHLRHSTADVRLAFLDSCRSGTMITMKGGRIGPEFNIRLTDEIDSKGYAIVTSSAENELSQESREIRGAFFTHYLVSALRGAGDESNDGKVTLSEAYAYAYRRTLARTSVTVGGSQHPMYEFQLEGKGDVILTQTDKAPSRLAIELPESGRLIVLDDNRQTIVAETEVLANQPHQIAVSAGAMFVYLVTPEGGVRASEITLSPHESATLDASDFQSINLEHAVEKGGLFAETRRVTHSVAAGGMWRMFALEGASSSMGATLIYRVELKNRFQPTLRLGWSTRGDVGRSSGYNDVGALIGVGYVYPVVKVRVRAELLVGYEHIFQSPLEGQARHTSGFDYLGIAGVSLPADHLVLSLDGAVGGRTFQVVDKGWVHRLDLQVVLSLGWQWEV